jgi:hypothetical protein
MDIQTIISLINGVGFPIFVSVYLLISTNKLIESNTQMMSDLKDEISKMNNKGV